MSKAESKTKALESMDPKAMSLEARQEVVIKKMNELLNKYDLELSNTIMWAPQGAVPRLSLADKRQPKEDKKDNNEEVKKESNDEEKPKEDEGKQD